MAIRKGEGMSTGDIMIKYCIDNSFCGYKIQNGQIAVPL